MCLILQGTRVQVQVLKPCKSVQESSEEVLFIKAWQMYLSRFKMWSSIDSLIAVSIENYENHFFRTIFHAYPSYVFRFSFLTTLDIYIRIIFRAVIRWLHLLLQAYCDRRQFALVYLSLEETVVFVCRRVLWLRSFLIFVVWMNWKTL